MSTPRPVSVLRSQLPLAHFWPSFSAEWIASQIEPWASRLRALLQTDTTTFWNAECFVLLDEEAGVPIAGAILDLPRKSAPSEFRVGWLSHVWTKPEFRGLGIATTLVAQCVARAGDARVERILLASSWATRPACLYRRVGFTPLRGSAGLMHVRLSNSVLGGGAAPDGLSGIFTVGLDDLSACAAVLGMPHYEITDGDWALRPAIDVEECICTQIADGAWLGTIHFLNDAIIGPVATLTNDTGTAIVSVKDDSMIDIARLSNIHEIVRSSAAGSVEFTYLEAHPSVA